MLIFNTPTEKIIKKNNFSILRFSFQASWYNTAIGTRYLAQTFFKFEDMLPIQIINP